MILRLAEVHHLILPYLTTGISFFTVVILLFNISFVWNKVALVIKTVSNIYLL